MRIIYTILALTITGLVYGQTWRSTLYPENWTPKGNFYTDKIIQDFSFAGYHRGEQAIPIVTTNIKDVTAAPYYADKTGATDVTTKIQQAINDVSSSGGGVVYLPAGTYKVSPGSNNYCLRIASSKVILRGAGKASTFIVNSSYKMNNKAIIKVAGNTGWYGTENNKTLIAKDLTGPVMDIPVKDAAAFKSGDLVVLRNYITDAWINEHKITQWLGYNSNLHGFAFCREVKKVDYTNNIITVDSPIRYSLLTRDNSAVYKVTGMLSEVGIESLSIGNIQHPATSGYGEEDYNKSGTPAYDAHASTAITCSGVVNCWINNVNTFKPSGNTSTAHLLSNGIVLNQTKNVTIINCHFQRPQYGGGGGNGYMYRVTGSDNLIKDCISEFTRHGFVFASMASSGNVIHHCTDIKTGAATGSTGYYKTSGNGSDHHMHLSTSNLIDQCTSQDSYFAAGFRNYGGNPIHGITSAHSVFWNTAGSGTTFPQVVFTQQARYGYVIGTSGTNNKVATGEYSLAGSSTITAPVDHVEGQGTGSTLQPQSLYLDQLSKRLATPTTNPSATNKVPTVSITSSVATGVAPASFKLTASAVDTDGSITKVEFYEGSVLLGTVTSSPFTISLTGVTSGTHSYTAKATDNCSSSATSSAIAVTISSTVITNQPPTVSFDIVLASSTLIEPGNVVLQANASDIDGTIAKVEFYNGTTLLYTDLASPYSYSWSGVKAGTYSLTAMAYDNKGATKSSTSVNVTINAAPTTVGISGPSCVQAGTANSYSITTGSNATNASWWANGDVTITPDPTNNKKVTVKLNSSTSSYVLTCGVNYSTSPYYKEYTKTIKVGGCVTRQPNVAISPYPSDQESKVMIDEGKIDGIKILDSNGQLIREISNTQDSQEVVIPSDLAPGLYILQIISGEDVIVKKYMKLK